MDCLVDVGFKNGLNHLAGFGCMISDLAERTNAEFSGIQDWCDGFGDFHIRPAFVDSIGAYDELLESKVLFTQTES
jgi:hypothetical protein